MKENYVKALLYAYPHVKKTYKAIGSQIKKKAHNSFSDLRPVEKQADEIIELINKKYLLGDMVYAVHDVVNRLDKENIALVKRKFFKQTSEPLNFERNDYRRLVNIPKKLSVYFKDIGVDDTYFEEEYFKIGLVRLGLEKAVNEEIINKNRAQARLREARKCKEAEVKDEGKISDL